MINNRPETVPLNLSEQNSTLTCPSEEESVHIAWFLQQSMGQRVIFKQIRQMDIHPVMKMIVMKLQI